MKQENRGMCSKAGQSSVMTSDPTLSLFLLCHLHCVAFGPMISTWGLHLQVSCSSYRQRERGRGEMMTKTPVSQECLCLSGEQKVCSEDPSSKFQLVSCGPDPCCKVMSKGRKDWKKCLAEHMVILHKISVLLTRVCPPHFPIIV